MEIVGVDGLLVTGAFSFKERGGWNVLGIIRPLLSCSASIALEILQGGADGEVPGVFRRGLEFSPLSPPS